MNLQAFSEINWARCTAPKGFNDIPSTEYLLTCLTEELGEIAGIIKKLKRGYNKREQKKTLKRFIETWEKDNPGHPPPSNSIDPLLLEGFWYKTLKAKLGPEIADLFTYLDLFATTNNVDLSSAAINKFNQVNKEMECQEFDIPNGPDKDLVNLTVNHFTEALPLGNNFIPDFKFTPPPPPKADVPPISEIF